MKRALMFVALSFCVSVGAVAYSGESSSGAKIQQIRNATLKIQFGGKTILVDPMLAPKNAFPPIPDSFNPSVQFPLVDLPLPVEEILQADAVLVTHLHVDHFDEVAVNSIPKDMLLIAQDEIDAATLRGYGFTNVDIMTYAGYKLGDVEIIKTDCVHGEKDATLPYYEAMGIRWEASGFILKHPAEEKVVYIAGDTIWYDGVDFVLKHFRPDVVVVNVAGAQLLTSGPIIMELGDLVRVIRATPDSTTIIASHLDTVSHATVTRKDVRKLIADYSITKVLVPEDGETVNF